MTNLYAVLVQRACSARSNPANHRRWVLVAGAADEGAAVAAAGSVLYPNEAVLPDRTMDLTAGRGSIQGVQVVNL